MTTGERNEARMDARYPNETVDGKLAAFYNWPSKDAATLGAIGCVESQPIQDTFNLSVSERIFWGSLSSRRELGKRIRTVQESWETSSI